MTEPKLKPKPHQLKIAFNIDHFEPQRGGAERYLYNLVKYLLCRGHEVHVFSMDGETSVQPEPNFVFHKVKVLGWFRWLKSLSFVVMSSREIKKCSGGFHIVQVLGKNLTMNVFQPHGGSHRASFRQNIKAFSPSKIIRSFYAFFRFLDPKQPLFFIIEWLQFHKKKQPQILAISKTVISDLKKYYKVSDSKIHLIYNGVDRKRFSLDVRRNRRDIIRKKFNAVNSQTKILLFAGHNFKLKGLRYFLELISRFKGENIMACIIGSAKAAKYKRLADKLGVKDCCVFLESIDKIEDYYSAADILVQPTFYDPCSLVVLEALSCGLPVITTRCNGAGELVKHGETGFIVDEPYCIAEMVDGVNLLLRQDARELAESANQSVSWFDNETVFESIEKFYKKLVFK
ncbi:glycosyltransferase family 4 protein [bacterium]|nr:glycosyltransferase family 4 protein [bacterium]